MRVARSRKLLSSFVEEPCQSVLRVDLLLGSRDEIIDRADVRKACAHTSSSTTMGQWSLNSQAASSCRTSQARILEVSVGEANA